MPDVFLAPIGNGFNFATTGWLPLAQGKLYTYLAGTQTTWPTWTTADGDVQNANPIVLGVDGRPPHEIWLQSGYAYLFVLKDEDDNPIQSYDDLRGIGDDSAVDCCTRIGHAASEDGEAFTATFDRPIEELRDGLPVFLIFDDDQTEASPTLEAVEGGDAVEIVNETHASLGAYRILAGDTLQLVYDLDADQWVAMNLAQVEELCFAGADQSSTITTGTKLTLNGFPGGKVVAVRCALATASSSGAVTFDINEGGVSIFSTAPTVDQDETSSKTAATQPVISDRTIADDATVTFAIDGAGSGAKGPIWYMTYRKTANY